MWLNSIRPAAGATAKPRRVGRGIGSGLGKTAGRGHKGQKSRAGGFHKVGFAGGQMPLQRRLPKRGFRSLHARHTAEVRLGALSLVDGGEVDILALRRLGLVSGKAKVVKVIASGNIAKPLVVRGLGVSKTARSIIEQAGGQVSE